MLPETTKEHAERHIITLKKLIANNPDDLMIPKWKQYLQQYEEILKGCK